MSKLTEDEQTTIQRGLEAQALLETPFFRDLLKQLSLECAVSMLETVPEDEKGRERLYYKHQGLQDIEAELRARIGSKETLMAHLEGETADTPESE